MQSGVSRRGDDQIVTVPLVPLETAPESMSVPTSSSSPAATAAGGSGPDRVAQRGPSGSDLTERVEVVDRKACCCGSRGVVHYGRTVFFTLWLEGVGKVCL